MASQVFVYDPTVNDPLSKVRGVGRYLQILRENFPDWHYGNSLEIGNWQLEILINPFFNLYQKPLTMRRMAKKQIAVIHDLIPLKYPDHFPAGLKGNINMILNQFALRNYDLVITDSETSKKDIVKYLSIPEAKIRVLYPCLPKVFSESENSDKLPVNSPLSTLNSQFCLYVGDATWNKNLVNLAKAIKIINVTCVFVGKVFEQLKKEDNHFRDDRLGTTSFVIGKDGVRRSRKLLSSNNIWLKEFGEFIRESENDKRFIFTGFIPDTDLINYYKQARLNVLPSRDEGFGFSYVEAATFGCPTILSDIPVFRELAGVSKENLEDVTAAFAYPENPNDLANKIGEIYFHSDLGRKIGNGAQQRAKVFSNYNFKKGVLDILNSEL